MDMTTSSSSCKWQQAADMTLAPARHHLLHGAPSRPLEGQQQQQQLPLRCPRCDSTNTKFCYYNNYSLSQPRHFCKACKRYWTRGGTLRNVPVGGGCRKNKRIRRTSVAAAAPTGPSSSSSNNNNSTPLLHIPTTSSSHVIKTTTLPTSSNLSPLLYALSGASRDVQVPKMDTIGIINEFESVLTNNPIGTCTPNEFQPQEHCSLPTSARSSLLQDYSLLGPSVVSSYPDAPRLTKTTTTPSFSSSAWFPFYQGLQGGAYAGDANLGLLKEIKEEARRFDLQPTCSENHLEPLASGPINPLCSSAMSGVWSTEPATTLFGSSTTTPLI